MDTSIILLSMIQKFYYYLYYRIYSTWKKNKSYDVAFTSAMVLSSLVLINIICVISLIRIFFLSITFITGKYIITILGLANVLINYFLFVHKNKFLKIEKRFQDETYNQKNARSVYIYLYVTLTFVFIFIVAMLKK